jgi:hypothetical protein
MARIPDHLLAQLQATVRSRPTPPLVEQIFRQASEFHEGAQRSLEHRTGSDGQSSFPFVSAVVGLAFACELYLKALYALETGKTRTGHRLNVLFAGLPAHIQRAVTERYEARRRGLGARLATDLVTFSNAFAEWRYVYEMAAGEMDVVGLGQLASGLYETCLSLKPELPRTEYAHTRLTAGAQGIPIFAPGRDQ